MPIPLGKRTTVVESVLQSLSHELPFFPIYPFVFCFFSYLFLFKEDHDVNASIHHLTFPNKAMFMRFVRWLEAEGGAHFRHKSGAKRRASGKGIFMACNR